MNKNLKIALYGVAIWLVPFFVAFFFVDMEGNYVIEEKFFKSIMVVSGALVGAYFAVRYFRDVKADYVKEGVVIGVAWLAINLALDLAMVYAGIFNMTLFEYATQIGMRYLAIPIYTVAMAYALKQR